MCAPSEMRRVLLYELKLFTKNYLLLGHGVTQTSPSQKTVGGDRRKAEGRRNEQHFLPVKCKVLTDLSKLANFQTGALLYQYQARAHDGVSQMRNTAQDTQQSHVAFMHFSTLPLEVL